jgi:hypothetical protein
LVAEGKRTEAREAFIHFLQSEPLSPLAKAAYKRLLLLNGGQTTAEYDRLIQRAYDAQQKDSAQAVVSCGPRVVQYVLSALHKADPGLDAITKACKTDKEGTTLANLQSAFKSFGVKSYGVQLDRDDLVKAPTPAILLVENHYLVLKEIHPDYAVIYDPQQDDPDSEKNIRIPRDKSFGATLLVFSVPSFAKD